MSLHDQYLPDSPRSTDLTRTRRRGRFDDEPDRGAARGGRARRPTPDTLEGPPPEGGPPDAGEWVEPNYSSWLGAVHGPLPRPDWVVTDLAAVDTELGILKTGKEADVHLLERAVPGTGRSSLLAVKRYRSSEHRMFHRDAGYLEGRRVRRSREMRAMTTRTAFGRDLLAGQWAGAEFAALSRLWELGAGDVDGDLGLRVPYPVQLIGTELMLEFVGSPDGEAAPRLAQLRPEGDELVDLWHQFVAAVRVLAVAGLAHGDLSPYNVLVHDGQLVVIDLPQVVDLVANPQGQSFLARDVRVMTAWFAARGLPGHVADADRLTADLLTDAGLT